MRVTYLLKTALLLFVTAALFSCSTSRKYFTPEVRAKIENAGVPLEKVQFYVDRDVQLTREIPTTETEVKKGSVKVIDGKTVNIIHLSKNTKGVCIKSLSNKVLISFEDGNNNFLTFGKTKLATPKDPYRVMAFEWLNDRGGVIKYEGHPYHITLGEDASLKIKSKFIRRANKILERKMKGNEIKN
jgi:hypothetical protein